MMVATRRLRALRVCLAADAAETTAAESPFPSAAAVGVVPTCDKDVALASLAELGFCVLDAVFDVGELRQQAEATARASPTNSPDDPTMDVVGVFNYDQSFIKHVVASCTHPPRACSSAALPPIGFLISS